MTATERLRALLDERGVEWWPMHDTEAGYHEDRDTEFLVYGCKHVAHEWGCRLQVDMLTPEQAVAATLGNDGVERSSDGVSERIKSVYLVMVADDLLEDGTPLCAYLDVPSAERRASRERYVDEDGVRHYAWVTEVKVVGE